MIETTPYLCPCCHAPLEEVLVERGPEVHPLNDLGQVEDTVLNSSSLEVADVLCPYCYESIPVTWVN